MGITWMAEWPVPDGVEVRQVYGILFDREGRVLVQDDDGRYNLPGGTPDKGDGGLLGTLERECLEESQVLISDAVPVGYQLVEEDGGRGYAQVRMAARIRELLPVTEDPCTGRAYRRLLVAPYQAADLLGWGTRASGQLGAAAELAAGQWGIVLAPGACPEYMD